MADIKKTTEMVEQVVRTTRDSYMTVVDHAVGMQERNVRFAQSIAEGSIKELREQADDNRAMTHEMVKRVENQREVVQKLAEESLDAYMDMLYAPLSYYKEGLKAVKTAR
jgi:CRISPR/Cas system-associated exonuclease Cas4 (RecB family)